MLLACVAVAVLIKTFVMETFSISSASMQPTLAVGDRVVVDKLTPRFGGIRRGDVVVFDGRNSFVFGTPNTTSLLNVFRDVDGTDFVKRVVGVAGDRVTCCDAEGFMSVNGVRVDESKYLYPSDVPSRIAFDVAIPPGKLWLMGDHRSDSADSRAHLGDPGGGFVSAQRVVGLVRWIVWPPDRVAKVPAANSLGSIPGGRT
jgi:signal peptidase I